MELTVDSPVTPDQMKLISAHAFSLDDPCIPSFLPSGTVDHTSALHLGAIFNIKSTSKTQQCDKRGTKRTSFYSIRAEISNNVALASASSNSSFLLVCTCAFRGDHKNTTGTVFGIRSKI